MPATTPVYSGFAPCSCARIISFPGPRPPFSTPRISTCIGSGFVPVNTVHAVAIIPRFTSLSGTNPLLTGGPSDLGPSGLEAPCARHCPAPAASPAAHTAAANPRTMRVPHPRDVVVFVARAGSHCRKSANPRRTPIAFICFPTSITVNPLRLDIGLDDYICHLVQRAANKIERCGL